MKEHVKDLVVQAYPGIAADLLRPLLRFMTTCLDHFDGNLTKFLVMLIVALRTTMHRDFASRTHEELISGAIPVFPGMGTNARSIAEALGLPKETVRRKVAELVGAGWIVRENGKLYLTARAYQELAPVREQIQALAVRYYEVVHAVRTRTEASESERGR